MPDAEQDDIAQAHRQALKVIREMAMDIAARLHAQSQEPDADLGEVATKFARVARAVRQTIWLEARLADEERRRREVEDPPEGRPLPPWIESHRLQIAQSSALRSQSKLEVGHLVGRAIAQQAMGPERERLEEALGDRLTRIDGGVEFAVESTGELIAGICRDLGLSPDWTKLCRADWRLARADTRKVLMEDASARAPPEMTPVTSDSGYNPPDPWPRGPP